jgi:hypothetical protein
MKVLSLIVGLTLSQIVFAKNLCTDPFHQAEVCERMRYLKASINVLDGQRELVQVNYPYLAAVGSTMKENIIGVMNVINLDQEDHLIALKNIKNEVSELEVLANAQDIKAVLKANTIRKNCAACHSGNEPVSGVKWGDVFYYDWEKVTKDCNRNGGNPFVCRSMNGLLTAYSHILTQMTSGVQDFTSMKQDGIEILRIFGDMKKVNAFHMRPELVAKAETDAQELVQLADRRDPMVYEKAALMTNACSACHTDFGKKDGFRFSHFKNQSPFKM